MVALEEVGPAADFGSLCLGASLFASECL